MHNSMTSPVVVEDSPLLEHGKMKSLALATGKLLSVSAL